MTSAAAHLAPERPAPTALDAMGAWLAVGDWRHVRIERPLPRVVRAIAYDGRRVCTPVAFSAECRTEVEALESLAERGARVWAEKPPSQGPFR